MSLRVVITIQDATLPEENRQVLLTGLAADLVGQLSAFYNGINVVVEDSYTETPGGSTTVTHEINSTVYGAYSPVYGGA